MLSHIIFTCWLFYSCTLVMGNACRINSNVMDCNGLMITDCPSMNSSVIDLIMKDNLLEDLNTRNCQDWVHLNSLTVASNRLQVVPNFQTFRHLKILNLSHNKINNVTISAPSLVELDISHNAIVNVSGSKLDNLVIFRAGYNKIDMESMGRILELLRNSHAIEIVDVSYNFIDWLPNQMRSFSPSNLSLINLAGNKLRVIDFGCFNRNIGQSYSIDLSSNEITDFSIHESINVRSLNLSNNKLSWIDGERMENFVGLEGIDLSHNPLNCLCSKSASFIRWIQEQSNIINHPQETICKIPSLKTVESVSCSGPNLLLKILEQFIHLFEWSGDQTFVGFKRKTISNGRITTKRKTSTTRRKTSTTRRKTSTTRRKTSTTRRKTSTTRRKTSTTRRKTSTTRRKTSTTRRKTSTTRLKTSTTKRQTLTTSRLPSTTKRDTFSTKRITTITRLKTSTAKQITTTSKSNSSTTKQITPTTRNKSSTTTRMVKTTKQKYSTKWPAITTTGRRVSTNKQKTSTASKRTSEYPKSTSKSTNKNKHWWIYLVGVLAAGVVITIFVIVYTYIQKPRRLYYKFVNTNDTI